MKIGIGFFCFGDERFFKMTEVKICQMMDIDVDIYILTDKESYFAEYPVTTISYLRYVKSYADKMYLAKHIFKYNDICILIDADAIIKDVNVINQILNHNYNQGVTYIDTLENHPWNKPKIGDISFENNKWFELEDKFKKIYPDYKNLDAIWEYFLVLNKKYLNDDFFLTFEMLQNIKEYIDFKQNKKILGAGEGLFIAVASMVSNVGIKRDTELFEMVKDNLISNNRR